MAQAGEFTLRAYLNGQMDLAQAEAVADLIASQSASQHSMAMDQLKRKILRKNQRTPRSTRTFCQSDRTRK